MAKNGNHVQLELRARTWGGKRDGAGRPRLKGKHDPSHRVRPKHVERNPVHIVLRVRKSIGRLRRGEIFAAARRALRSISSRSSFRVVHISLQHNHVHLIVEATDRLALSRGAQALTISLAKAINASLGRTGKVFEYRYHSTEISSPRQTRHALAYVINNWRRHREDVASSRASRALIDPYSSGIAFDGWRGHPSFPVPDGYEPLPVSRPQTWLLREGWRRAQLGEIDVWEVPGRLH